MTSIMGTYKNNFEQVPRDFGSNFVLKIAGILCVLQYFYKQKLGQKVGHFAKSEF